MSRVALKSPAELALMREAGKLLAQVFHYLDTRIVPGISTMAIDRWAERYIVDELHARPASKGQYDYPFVLNASVNHVVCHGIPSDTQILTSGDIVNVDITLEKNGFIADSSKTYLVGDVTPNAKRLVDKTYEAMWQGIHAVKPGATLGDVGYAIQYHAERHGYSVVREYCGHGIGREMHEEPQVLHYGKRGKGLTLQEGMVFTIEPMINMGKAKIKTKRDGWTVVTSDKKLSAQWEHTVAVTATGVEVLTLRDDEHLPVLSD
ncbi:MULTISPECIES: type I methionyl aminopeptidase [unclassified Halomonas]|uniref:type I methionyl aminopeptidase n=1 Tax=unclassified Halomonas TaxID=2609666 RepID=UPI001119E610|nr:MULTISPECIES: type I methionyl aminopeptidase [unclassified Halomonas]MCG7588947.1 type I methionyl aminopeptidase [Halomonas sp. McD50-5]MCG7615108.1 type I methionyl aminopeptidase [Halomonas sp. McD50-4]TNH15814.1 type I methionyl aminopeptidase [Halomonas sp. BL6]BCB62527.1 methionine aminopeptidase [Halomonas sp. A020]